MWEYMTLTMGVKSGFFSGPSIDGQALNYKLNELGAENWELVSNLDLNAYEGKSLELVMVFKRPRIS